MADRIKEECASRLNVSLFVVGDGNGIDDRNISTLLFAYILFVEETSHKNGIGKDSISYAIQCLL